MLLPPALPVSLLLPFPSEAGSTIPKRFINMCKEIYSMTTFGSRQLTEAKSLLVKLWVVPNFCANGAYSSWMKD